MTPDRTGEVIELYCLKPSDAYWRDLLQAMPHDFYHLPAYVALEARRLGGIPEGLLMRQEDCYFFLPYIIRDCALLLPDYIADAAPQDIVSPYGYASGLLSEAARQSPRFLAAALKTAMAFWQDRRFCTAYLRLHPLLYPELAGLGEMAIAGLERRQVGRSVAVDLSLSEEALLEQPDTAVQEQVKAALQAGFTVRWSEEYMDLADFVALYQRSLRRMGATAAELFEPDYFYGLAQALGEHFHLCFVAHQGLPLAAGLVTETCGIVQCHLSGSRADMAEDGGAGSLMLAAIRDWSRARGNRWLHLGTGLEGTVSDGLYRFNQQFSPLSLPVHSLRLVLNQNQYEQLIHERGKRLNSDPAMLQQAVSFPAYRAILA